MIAALAARRWWVIGGATALVAAVVAVVGLTGGGDDAVDSTAQSTPVPTSVAGVPAGPTTTVPTQPSPAPAPAPAPAGPVVAPDALAPLLLSVQEAGQLLNVADMTASEVEHQMLAGDVAPPHCTGAWGPAYRTTYDGTGYTGLAIQLFQQARSHQVVQAVVAFGDPGAAKGVYDRLVADWNACQSTRITYTFQGDSRVVDVTTTRPIGDIVTVMLIPTNPPVAGQQCERGLALRGNVIVDVRACSPTVGSAGYAITRAIADKVR